MTSRKHLNRITAWMAIFAILLTVLAPGISSALETGLYTQSIWNEICSASGSKLIKATESDKSGSSGSVQSCLDHCPYCSLQTTSPAILGLPSPLIPFLDTRLVTFVSTGLPYFLSEPRTFAQPRAPPSHT
ncbi:DUF2946 domain-containing protein [Sapientia aquatica]|uniref:DUF2946 domain-containing protein n=1 Tax=Sapientia aquatica TaxID=1549640 RepID=A0A4R5W4V8_9BURK|nr:DUF2946 domain-containing protein [Sapientia aquatica]